MKEFASLYRAIKLAEWGYDFFPLMDNSKTPPKGHHGYLEATRDQNIIMDWFQNNGLQFGIAVRHVPFIGG